MEEDIEIVQKLRYELYKLKHNSDRTIASYNLPGDDLAEAVWFWSINMMGIEDDRKLKNKCINWCNKNIGKQTNWLEPTKYVDGKRVEGGWDNNTWYFGGNHTFHFHKFTDAVLFWIVWC